jgi:ferredoxin--NADP+ reductase
VAIVGSGPAGIYAGNLLSTAVAEAGGEIAIDLFESLPAPYGLIRYGVSPDHPRIKGVIDSLHHMLHDGDIRFIGNIEVGRDVSVAELRERYHAVILATGALRDAALPIPGVELPGSYGAADFVAWYDGHPDVPRTWPLDQQSVAVIGNGNVALDVARVLAKHGEDMRTTDVPDNVLEGLEGSSVTDVHVFGRRGPSGIKFTPIELRELGEVRDLDIILDDDDFALDADTVPATNQVKVMLRILNSWREREVGQASRRLHLHFWHTPVAVLGDDRVAGLRFARTRPGADGALETTDELREYEVGAVYRAIGYYGTRVEGAPFDDARGVVPNAGGRVEAGLYATGWVKRGPIGLIGSTKSDALETIGHVVADAQAGLLAAPVTGDILDLLAERGVRHTDWTGWLELDAHERALGENHVHRRERIKVVDRDEQVDIAGAGVLAL